MSALVNVYELNLSLPASAAVSICFINFDRNSSTNQVVCMQPTFQVITIKDVFNFENAALYRNHPYLICRS
jgi:hypothetical protein